MRYLLRLAYKGTAYHGWQRQDNAHSVQEELEIKLSLLTGENITCLGCGRTDTGVHARCYYAQFDTSHALDKSRFVYKLNQILPHDIAVYGMAEVAPDFSARYDATLRAYEYYITRIPDPFATDTAWYLYGELDVARMNEAAQRLIGKKDFEAFSKTNTQVNHFECEVFNAWWEQRASQLVFTIEANRFLRNMVRAIVGTLIEVGRGKLEVNDLQKIIEGKSRSDAGQSVPAQGLFLTRVEYPGLNGLSW